MPPPDDVILGPLTRTVLDGAVWRDASVFPAFQDWADEVEGVLSFLESQRKFETFLPRLRARERDGAFAEARVAFFFHRNGFDITDWEPAAVVGRPGDLEVRWRNSEPIFVEVKGPGWEGELTLEQIQAGRQHGPKYINAEARAVGPVSRVLYAVDKAIPKLDVTRCNLVVVVDDLFLSPTEMPRSILKGQLTRGLSDPKYVPVSAVFLLNPASYGQGVEYRKYFVPNPGAARPLPAPVHDGLLQGNDDPQGPQWARDRRD
jgi:hypothetical protein